MSFVIFLEEGLDYLKENYVFHVMVYGVWEDSAIFWETSKPGDMVLVSGDYQKDYARVDGERIKYKNRPGYKIIRLIRVNEDGKLNILQTL